MTTHPHPPQRLRVAILGAGPIGLEAALRGAHLGHDVFVLERGEVGHGVQSWGHVRLFSPWALNRTALGAERLARAGYAAPDPAACPTGEELVEHYLLPLSRDPLLTGRVRPRSRVLAVSRDGLLKEDLIGRPSRARHRFRVLVEDHAGEHVEHADVVLDCTGTYGCPRPLGDGGIPAPGERWLGERILRHLPDLSGAARARFAGRRTLLVGGGLSAATAIRDLAALAEAAPGTEVLWAARRMGAAPYEVIEGDALPERERLVRAANELARRGEGGPLRFLHGAFVEAIATDGDQLRVTLRVGADRWLEERFDEVLSLTGYGPDSAIYRELQVHECYASRGPMKLAASLLGASGDCMAQPTPGPDTLRSPEPRFFILGQKSYGTGSAFLLRVGHAQVEQVFGLLD